MDGGKLRKFHGKKNTRAKVIEILEAFPGFLNFEQARKIENAFAIGDYSYVTKDFLDQWYAEAVIMNRTNELKYLNLLSISSRRDKNMVTNMRGNHNLAIKIMSEYLWKK